MKAISSRKRMNGLRIKPLPKKSRNCLPICKRGIRKTLCIPTERRISGNQENRKEQFESRGDKGGQCGKAGMESDS